MDPSPITAAPKQFLMNIKKKKNEHSHLNFLVIKSKSHQIVLDDTSLAKVRQDDFTPPAPNLSLAKNIWSSCDYAELQPDLS